MEQKRSLAKKLGFFLWYILKNSSVPLLTGLTNIGLLFRPFLLHPPLTDNFFPDCLVFVVLQSTQILLSTSDSNALSHPPIRVSDKRFRLRLAS